MSRSSTLLLPGEKAGRSGFVAGRAAAAAAAGFLWLPLQATLIPALGLSALPFDPLLPLVAAFALGGRGLEAWALAAVAAAWLRAPPCEPRA